MLADDPVVDRSLPWYMESSLIPTKLAMIRDAELKRFAESFLRDGYVVIPQSVSANTCDQVLAEFKDVERRNQHLFYPHRDDHGHYPRMINMHLVVHSLRRLFYENKMSLALQDYLFQSETVLYTSLFYERGSAQDIHRDTPYFCTRPEYRYFGMWVALEDVDYDNGPLMVMKGGHLMPELDRESIATELFGSPDAAAQMSDQSWNVYQERVMRAGLEKGLSIEAMPVSKGSTIIWHPQLPHGGSPIQDLSRSRFSLVMHTTPANTPVYYQDVFFNPNKFYPTEAPWMYLEDSGRKIAMHDSVGFNHKVSHGLEEFN